MVSKLKEQIAKLVNQINDIQTQCSHPKACVTKKHKADTGNWCKADDCYWTEFHCSLCDKHWNVDGSV